jgi:hypothetical protein
VPVSAGGPIVRISPAGRPTEFLRHSDLLRVEKAPRDLATTQFRFATLADGTESIESVDLPGKYLKVDGSTIRLDATPTGFRRTIVRNGVTIKAADGRYLRDVSGLIKLDKTSTVFGLS